MPLLHSRGTHAAPSQPRHVVLHAFVDLMHACLPWDTVVSCSHITVCPALLARPWGNVFCSTLSAQAQEENQKHRREMFASSFIHATKDICQVQGSGNVKKMQRVSLGATKRQQTVKPVDCLQDLNLNHKNRPTDLAKKQPHRELSPTMKCPFFEPEPIGKGPLSPNQPVQILPSFASCLHPLTLQKARQTL